jgi:transposase
LAVDRNLKNVQIAGLFPSFRVSRLLKNLAILSSKTYFKRDISPERTATMRGDNPSQGFMFSFVSPEQRVPENHPLRAIKAMADKILIGLSDTFSEMYSRTGRPSIPPESLLKSMILISLYSIRSDRLFCETLNYNILFRWFLNMNIDGTTFDHSVFSKNRDRLLEHEVAQQFFFNVVQYARQHDLLSDEHFTVDGTLIEAWASLKSFKRKTDECVQRADDDPGNPTVNFHGDKRSNQTHQSTTDPEARLARKGRITAARLCFTGHVLMENRNGLCMDIAVAQASGTAERDNARQQIERQWQRGKRQIKTIGADKGYYTREFVKFLRKHKIKPHIAVPDGKRVPGIDGRTTQRASYQVSQKKRKRVEEIFGWLKTVGGLRKARLRGTALNQLMAHISAASYNLIRMAKLLPLPAVVT